MKLNLGSGANPLEGFTNLDKENGWTFESGLGDYADESVEGCSISHALMYVAISDWPFVFSEIARVLEPGGVVRITEDSTDDPHSPRYGGFPGAVTLTSADLIIEHMQAAGLDANTIPAGSSFFHDNSLIQEHHGLCPKVVHVEGYKR